MNLTLAHINHPSGKLFDVFCQFADAHPNTSFFQSAAFIELVDRWPEADWVLLLALHEEGLTDPGARRTGNAVAASVRDPGSGPAPAVVSAHAVAGALLAVSLHEPAPANALMKRIAKVYRRVTTRTLVYGGPLLAPDTRLRQELVLKMLLDGLNKSVGRKSLFTQFRNSFDLDEMKPLFREMGYNWQDRLNLLIDTSSAELAWQKMTGNRRRQVTRSIENGATVIQQPSAGQVGAFYELLLAHYREKVKKPLPGKSFFLALNHLSENSERWQERGKHCGSTPAARYFLVACDGRIIGGSVCVFIPGRMMHEWYACGLDHEYNKRRIFPSVLSTWAAMEFAAKNNIPLFDFMGMGRPDVPYGVRNFKKEFGGRWLNPGRFNKINQPILYSLSELGYNALYLFKK